jgi:hypothetical protein
MHNVASILVLIFLAVTFIQSAYEKIFYWQDNLEWLKGLFEKTFLKNYMVLVTGILVILELLAGIFCCVGIAQMIINDERFYGFYGGVFSCICLIFMLFGQRLIRDYDGARNIVIYFIPAVMVVYWLG